MRILSTVASSLFDCDEVLPPATHQVNKKITYVQQLFKVRHKMLWRGPRRFINKLTLFSAYCARNDNFSCEFNLGFIDGRDVHGTKIVVKRAVPINYAVVSWLVDHSLPQCSSQQVHKY